jgi:hypothetical protein
MNETADKQLSKDCHWPANFSDKQEASICWQVIKVGPFGFQICISLALNRKIICFNAPHVF